MQQLSAENKITIKQLNLLADSVTLNQKINHLKDNPHLQKMIEGIEEADELIRTTNTLLKRDLANARKEYDKVMRDLRETQADIVNCLLKIKKRKMSEERNEILLNELPKTPRPKLDFVLSPYEQKLHLYLPRSAQKQMPNSASKQVPHSALKQLPRSALKQVQLQMNDLSVTPKISIKEYKESPLVKKVKLNFVPFDFLDFDVCITKQQFESIPKYMRGRTSYDDLQHFLEHTVVPCFNEKYKLLHRKRDAVQHTKEFELWKLYNSQISYVPGCNFITAGDISRKMQRMIDKKTQNYLVMIRHLGILQEQRISQTICYIWTFSE